MSERPAALFYPNNGLFGKKKKPVVSDEVKMACSVQVERLPVKLQTATLNIISAE